MKKKMFAKFFHRLGSKKKFFFAPQIIKCWKLCLNKYGKDEEEKNYKCDFHRAIISNSCIFSLFLIGAKLSMNNILRHCLIPVTFLITRKIKDNPFLGERYMANVLRRCFSRSVNDALNRFREINLEKISSEIKKFM